MAAALAFGAAAQFVHAAPAGWDPVWSDEFPGSTLDTSKWTAESTTTPANNERQAYLPQQVSVSGGNLVITSENIPFGGKPYRSGRVHSNLAHRFGRWEVRADLPTSRGMWPAIWLLPDTTQYNWPSQGEIDIMENRGHQPNLTSSAFHYGTNPPYNHQYEWGEQTTGRFGQSENFHSGFHIYAVEWDAKKLRFLVDDVHYLTIHNADVGGFLASQSAPMRTMLNTAVGGDFLGAFQPDASTVWPQRFLIDYVRVFERNGDPLRFRNGGFEQHGGSLGSWTVFGNKPNMNNVSVHNEATLEGAGSLKLFGQYTGVTNYSGVSQGISVAAGDAVEASAESFVRSQDALAAGTSVQLKIEFYSEFGGQHGTSALLHEVVQSIADPGAAKNVWRSHAASAVAPAGAVEARLALVFTQTGSNGGGAVHIDNVSFKNMSLSDVADANGDGAVDGADFLRWQRQLGTPNPAGPQDGDFNFDGSVDQADLDVWKGQQGASAAEQGAGRVVPEPGVSMLVWTTLVGALTLRPAMLPGPSILTSAAR